MLYISVMIIICITQMYYFIHPYFPPFITYVYLFGCVHHLCYPTFLSFPESHHGFFHRKKKTKTDTTDGKPKKKVKSSKLRCQSNATSYELYLHGVRCQNYTTTYELYLNGMRCQNIQLHLKYIWYRVIYYLVPKYTTHTRTNW